MYIVNHFNPTQTIICIFILLLLSNIIKQPLVVKTFSNQPMVVKSP